MKKETHLPIRSSNRNVREKLRDKGQFWTPDWVAEVMVKYVSKKEDLIFDPATGRGAFFKALLQLNEKNINFYGIDNDEEVIKEEIYNNPRCKVEVRDFIKDPPKRKFRAIIANPPYIRHHRIDKDTKQFLKQLCLKITGFKIDGRAGFHIYFLLQALNLLESNGNLAFIMPSDTFEGTFATQLWNWIAYKYCIEAIITFDEKAAPFPNVDTNAIIIFIKNSKPQESFSWIKVKEPVSYDLIRFIEDGCNNVNYSTLTIQHRLLKEALTTGFSRSEQSNNGNKYHLNDFAKVMRGIATGANGFFFLTQEQASKLNLPSTFLKTAIGRTRDVPGSIITENDLRNLIEKKRPTLLFSMNKEEVIPTDVLEYLKQGEKAGLPERPLIKQRKPWYKMESRLIPPILFAYLGRRNSRFIRNDAKILPLTGFLCVYPFSSDERDINNLWQALNHPDTLANLQLVGKSYGSGAIKVEPRNLDKLPIPDHIVEKYKLHLNHQIKNYQIKLL